MNANVPPNLAGRELMRNALINELNREEHLAILLCHAEKMVNAEIAAVLEISESQATTLLHTARRKLRAVFRQAQQGQADTEG